MDVGIFVFATAYSLDTAVLAKHAEEVGFTSFWVPEHPILPVTTTSPYRGSADGVIPDAYKRVLSQSCFFERLGLCKSMNAPRSKLRGINKVLRPENLKT